MFLVLSGLGLEPAKIVNNLTDQKVNMSVTVTLLCEVVGTPIPRVVWTKNNHTVVQGSGERSTATKTNRLFINEFILFKLVLLLKTCTCYRCASEPA